MTAHPSEATLMAHAAGQLGRAHATVVSAHAETCPHCRERLADFAAIGGVLLEELPLASMAGGFDRLIERIDREENAVVEAVFTGARPRGGPADDIRLPAALDGLSVGRWRWMGPGMKYARVGIADEDGVQLVFLSIAPGQAMPEHGHSGREFTLVLQGSFGDARGRFVAGDFAEEDEDTEHTPVVAAGVDCICLASIEGRMRPRSLVARLVQPFIGL